MTTRLPRSTVLATVAAIVSAVPAQAAGGYDDTVVLCAPAAPRGFDPGIAGDGPTIAAGALPIYDRLLDYEPGQTALVPSLAEAWSVSDDGLTYTFHLRPDVHFQETPWFTPTRTFNAEDVLFSFGRLFDSTHPWFGVNEVATFGPMADLRELVAGFAAVDDHTVTLTLNRPRATLLSDLSGTLASIASAEYAAQLDAAGNRAGFEKRPVGTGPYAFVEYVPDVATRLRAHEQHWRGPALTENLIVAIVIDQATRVQKVLAGECHVAPQPGPGDIERLETVDGVSVLSGRSLNYAYLAFNNGQSPFDRASVRRAIAHAIDREIIVEAVYGGRAEVADTPVPPALAEHSTSVTRYDYDPDKARALLAAEGIDGFSMKLWAMPVQRDYNPNSRRMAELMSSDLEAVGISVEVVTYEWSEYLRRSRDPNHDGAVLLGWIADSVNPDNFLAPMYSCTNIGGMNRPNWCNEAYDALLVKAGSTSDPEERARLLDEAQAIIADQLPALPIAYADNVVVVSDRVEGYAMEPMGWHRFHRARVRSE